MTAAIPGPSSLAAIAPAAAPRLPSAGAIAEQAMQVGRKFEQMFLSQMLAPIFETIRTDGPFGGGNGERMMRSFQIDAYAESIVRTGGIGLASGIAREILRMQEKSDA